MTTHDGETLMYQNIGGPCSVGHYCPTGTPIEIPCTPGKLCNTAGLPTPTKDCDEGYYCEEGASDSNGLKKDCPKGYYCIKGSAEPIPCPAGTYSNNKWRTSVDQCNDCPKNYYCPNVAATAVDYTNHKCFPGFTCPEGSTHDRPVICPKGYKCPQDSADAIACDGNGEYQD